MPTTKKYIPLAISTALAVGILIGSKLNNSASSDLTASNYKKNKLNKLIDYIDFEYVDQVNTDSIVDITVNKILDNLDPHSVYIPQQELKDNKENMSGNFVGIGVSFYTYKDTIAVIRPIKNGPSHKAGIVSGDRILIANKDTLFGKKANNTDITKKLKGPLNSTIKLKVYRKSKDSLINVTLKRSKIPIKSVDAAYMLSNKLGYIKINRFAETTYKEFKTNLNSLLKQGATQLAIDLRDNPGGFLHIAEQILDELLEDNTLLLFTKNKRGDIQKSFATNKGIFKNKELFILINEKSASASEIVAGALQDNDKGTIIGRRSYGKGLVQRDMSLGDGSVVRLTISRYYTPTGRSIQRQYKKGNKDYFDEYFERLSSGELTDSMKIKVSEDLKFKTPKGKIVYGGGGIIPDVFIPITTQNPHKETLNYLHKSGFIRYFIFEVLDKNRNAFNSASRQDFIDNFVVPNSLVIDFQTYLNKHTTSNIELASYNKDVKHYIKATLANQLYDPEALEEILNKKDAMINKVIELSNAK